jgi:YYY domain-containing protein
MLDFIFWYLMVAAVGWISFPVIFRLVPNLPDRGYSFSKIFGLLLWGYLYWILGRLGVTANNLAGLLFTLFLTAGLGVLAIRKIGGDTLKVWIREFRTLIFTTEILFLLAFAGWAVIRSFNPEINSTEKPMELAFINAILNSETFPPHDPWLSGYAISYYYFGYILVAMLAKISGTLGSVAFNLGVSLIFALSAVGSFGILFNLTGLNDKRWKSSLMPALLGPFYALIISNWEGFLHFLHSRKLFWKIDSTGQMVSPFWRWLDIQNLTSPPTEIPFGHWWWWRASRVIQDYDFSGFGKEVISEFPFFSFLLADLHPHVLSLPFVFLIGNFALELYLRPKKETFRWLGVIPLEISPWLFGILAWLAGSMAFLNIWNFPMYVGILAGAYVLRNNRDRAGWPLGDLLKEFLFLGFTLGITGGALYFPWYLGFTSQAGGLIPNVLYITRGSQFWVMFGPLLIPIFAWLICTWRRRKADRDLRTGLMLSGILILVLFLFMLALIGLMNWLPIEAGGDSLVQIFLGSIGASDLSLVMVEGLIRRVSVPGTLLTLFALAALSLGLVFHRRRSEAAENDPLTASDLPDNFIFLLILGGMILALVPEFVFLKDLFGYRINTIFKFYYQTWLLWSTAAAYGTITLFRNLKSPNRYIVFIGLALSMIMALFYPIISLQSKTNNFNREDGLTLDGFYIHSAADAEAVGWLREAPPGVIAEAVGRSYYSSDARMATYSGKPNVLGWDFHEIQWRGGSELVMPRKEDMSVLYCTHNWDTAKVILEKYQVSYLVVGDVEYTIYEPGNDFCPNGLIEEKFINNMIPVYRNERLSIYTMQGVP